MFKQRERSKLFNTHGVMIYPKVNCSTKSGFTFIGLKLVWAFKNE